MKYVDLSIMLGVTFEKVEIVDSNKVCFWDQKGDCVCLEHFQDCCESVTLEDVIGDINNLVGAPLLMAECVTNSDNPLNDWDESFTWSFYKFATRKGYVTFRWYGESNGYYSEEIDVVLYRKEVKQ